MPTENLAAGACYWREEGVGARSVFLVHCTLAHSGAWKGLFPYLAPECHMVAMDMPEHGRSGSWDRSRSWQRQTTEMAVALLERGAVPADLIGHSFGATVALRIAVERPDLVRSLTLIEPVFMSAAEESGRPEFQAHMNKHRSFYTLVSKGENIAAAKMFAALWGADTPWDALSAAQQTYQAERIAMIKAGGDSIVGTGPDYIPLSKVAEISVPVLLMDGSKTDPVIPAVQEELQKALPDCRRVVVEGAGHMLPISHPEETARAIRSLFGLPQKG